jgi:hypothetical protein
MSASDASDDDSPPALGSRHNWWGTDPDGEQAPRGHVETSGTDPAGYKAFQLLLRFVAPVCGETGRELSEPSFYLPKQDEVRPGQYREYRQQRHRRRVEPESGRINWDESTTTDLPDVGYDVYQLAVHTYLAERDCRLTEVEDYLSHAERVWHDPQYDSRGSLEQLVSYVRDAEGD